MPTLEVGVLAGKDRVLVPCLAPDCTGQHTTYRVEDVLLLPTGTPLDEARAQVSNLDECIEHGIVAVSSTMAYETLYGAWYTNASDN
jgi:hypothetical protein